MMSFESLDQYLLTGTPEKAGVVAALLADRSPEPAASAFYEGMRLLGRRTPDLTLIALRLVVAGKRADDASVVELRRLIERAREGDAAAREAYAERLKWNG
jgi:hypothetical protein